MAFTAETFIPVSGQANSDASRIFSYSSGSDTLATIKASGYFNTAADPTGGYGLTNGDVVLASGSDGTSFLKIAVSGSVASTSEANDFI